MSYYEEPIASHEARSQMYRQGDRESWSPGDESLTQWSVGIELANEHSEENTPISVDMCQNLQQLVSLIEAPLKNLRGRTRDNS